MSYEEYIQQELAKEANEARDNFYRGHFRVTERHLNGVLFYDVHKLGKLPVIFSSSSMDEVREFQRLKLEEDKNFWGWFCVLAVVFFFFDTLKEMYNCFKAVLYLVVFIASAS